MLSEIEIISKVAELILQSRIDVKKALFTHFERFLSEVEKFKDEGFSSIQFLRQLLPKDYYFVAQKYSSKLHSSIRILRLQINFYLIERSSGDKREVEAWNIEILKKRENQQQSVQLIANYFKELILMLNKLPLFSVYQKDRELKLKYLQDYTMLLDKNRELSLIDLPAKDLLLREDAALKIRTEISYLPSFKSLKVKENLIEESRRRISIATSQQGDKKVSVYAFYDPELEFTFLSSDDEDFNKKGNSETIELRVEVKQEESEEFQLLISNQEEDFINDNKDILDLVVKYERQYFNS